MESKYKKKESKKPHQLKRPLYYYYIYTNINIDPNAMDVDD